MVRLVSDVFHALSAPARRAILDALQRGERQTLFELCTRLTARRDVEMSRQAISQHLTVLEEAGLVHTRKEGRYKLHHVDLSPLEQIQERWATSKKES